MILVVDYGVNNVASVVRAVSATGHAAELSTDPERVRRASRLLLPGVGNFGPAAGTLRDTGLADALREAAAAGTPLMGICLGMQLFFASSEEAPGDAGLGILDGTVRRFGGGLAVPHVGWARIEPTVAGRAHSMVAPVFGGEPRFFYHVHSYHPADLPAPAILAVGDYGGPFPALVGRDNIVGAQFHPEKSQRAGLELLAAFAAWKP